MSKRVVIIILALIVVLAGGVALWTMSKDSSGQANSDTTNQGTTTQNDKSSTTNSKSSVQTNTVTIQDYAYAPASITVKVGTTVTWTNKDAVGHTVTVESGDGPDSPLIDQGKTYSYTFTKAGTYNYFCKPHPYMKGVVIVTE